MIGNLGSAAFQRRFNVCMLSGHKVIENNKDCYDQSIEEIKLRYINNNRNAYQIYIIKMYDFFYHKEHLFLVAELLRDNLYEYPKFNMENGDFVYYNWKTSKMT